ncbi:chalcone isomerase family protein [Aquabacterium sp.]|uniref:chalcone isomerase family protein n=1 Tax=Aquabacterium sp. TaxID=1872578 RepID=UPI0019B52EE1|nr:chalcone isomerase family protein [Aquabacterium sp.]MBC7701632.1 chalcone isomerase family protein [Aquabacterium sp.]
MKRFTSSIIAAAILGLSAHAPVQAMDVAGVQMEDTAKVGGKDLVLSNAGVRIKVLFKVYALGIYLNEKKSTVADILGAPGPKRFKLVMMRDVSGEEFGSSFMGAINKNLDKDEKSKFVNQLLKFGEMFETIGALKKGDVILSDWVPGTGTVLLLNGKPIVEPLPDAQFYSALLKIWLGDKPVDTSLKPVLLGEKHG